ncbi:MAG: transposase [Chitinispirillaceae bacterium]|nr:transposase [Chitinispirillaceae bacterium]
MYINNGQCRKKIQHYNTPGHAHMLTFTCYHKRNYLSDPKACEILVEEIGKSRHIYSFLLWAFVVMPDHVHLLLWPAEDGYDISKVLSGIKQYASKRYGRFLKETNRSRYERFLVRHGTNLAFTLWRPGGGFDRNAWHEPVINRMIRYIENNPVRKNLVKRPEEWPWSSAFTRYHKTGMLPDKVCLPVREGKHSFQGG